MVKHYKENWKIYHIVFMTITLLFSCPSYVLNLNGTGIDPSWIYAVNKLFSEGYIGGKDYVFTNGILGFLVNCRHIGYNIKIAFIFWLVIWIIHGIFLFQLLFKQKEENQSIMTLIGLFLFLLNSPIAEYYIAYIGLLSILLAMSGHKRDIYVFSLIMALSLYIKFSLFMLMAAIMIIYLVFGYFQDKKLYGYCCPRICLGVILTPLIYFILNGVSVVNFKNYIKGSIELASGYNVAMSYYQYDAYVVWVIVAAIACGICLIMLAKCGMQNFMVMAFVSVCLLMLYKHGFVRTDGHATSSMSMMIIFISLAFVFLDWNYILNILGRWKSLYLIMFTMVVSIVIIQDGLSSINIVSSIRNKVINFPLKVEQIREQKDKELNPLPYSIVEAIGDATVSIYPWEISYCISNELNYVPLTVLQAYVAYTPYLDRITAEKFLAEDAPEYIIFQMNTIDNRWPFIECPQTWEAIRNNYYVELQDMTDQMGYIFLLKHNDEAPGVVYESLRTITQDKGDTIELQGADYIKLTADLNWKGKLAKIFWKIPEVNMTVYYKDGNEEGGSGRVLLDLFSEGVEVGSVVCHSNIEQLVDMLNEQGDMSKVDSICLSGDGLVYYKDNITVEFFSTNEVSE